MSSSSCSSTSSSSLSSSTKLKSTSKPQSNFSNQNQKNKISKNTQNFEDRLFNEILQVSDITNEIMNVNNMGNPSMNKGITNKSKNTGVIIKNFSKRSSRPEAVSNVNVKLLKKRCKSAIGLPNKEIVQKKPKL